MADLALTARQISPRLASKAFDAAFGELANARLAYEGTPREPQDIAQLGRASARLADARSRMQATLHGRRAS